ncbi:hypothetical protein [Grimontia celer]|nr:hypothetical protein [Grimontia celer]
MKLLAKLVISYFLFSYTFMAVWLALETPLTFRNPHWYVVALIVFTALISLWVYTWFCAYRKHAVVGLLFSLLAITPYCFASQRVLFLFLTSSPLLILSSCYVFVFFRRRKNELASTTEPS